MGSALELLDPLSALVLLDSQSALGVQFHLLGARPAVNYRPAVYLPSVLAYLIGPHGLLGWILY